MKKLVSILICVALVATFSLIGCKEEKVSETAAEETAAEETIVEETTVEETTVEETTTEETIVGSDIETTLKITSFNPVSKAVDETVTNIFNEKYPNVTVEFIYSGDSLQYRQTTANSLLAGEKGTDIFLAWTDGSSRGFYDVGGFLDLSDWELTEKVPQDVWDAIGGHYDPAKIGFPLLNMVWVTYYNLDMFNEYNLDIPTNWEEYQKVADEFLENGVTPAACGLLDTWPIYRLLGPMEQNLRPEPMTNVFLNLEKGGYYLDVLEALKLMWDKGWLDDASMGMGYQDELDSFSAGKYPMMHGMTLDLSTIRAAESPFELDVGITPFNATGEPLIASGFFDSMWSINSKSAKVDLAKEWIKTYIDNYVEYVKLVKAIPIYPVDIDLADVDPIIDRVNNFKLQAIEDGLWRTHFTKLYLPSGEVLTTMGKTIQEMFLGNITVEETGLALKTEYDKAVSE